MNIVRVLLNNRRYLKKKHSKLKNTITEMKNVLELRKE